MRIRQAILNRLFLLMLVSVPFALISPEPVSVFFAVLSLGAIFTLLWTPDEPPILLIAPLLQWTQVALVPLSTIWIGLPMLEISRYGGQTEAAALYGLAGVTMLAIGMRIGLNTLGGGNGFAIQMRLEATQWSQRDVLLVSMTAIVAGYVFEAGQGLTGGLREAFNQASGVKYGGLFILVYWSLVTGRSLQFMAIVVVVELFMGMTGFFADFLGSALVVGAAVMAAQTRFRGRDLAIAGVFGGLILMTAIFWSAVKPDYRSFVNLGTGQQLVAVPFTDRAGFLLNEVAEFDRDDLIRGVDALGARHGYIGFLGLTLEHVPAYRPHEDGALTLAALRHISMPRVLFPGKPPLPWDTDVMARYTGLPNNWDRRTSISIGHLGELYVDFGRIGGLLAMGVWGFIIARGYGFLRDHARSPVLMRAAVCSMIVLPVAYFGTALAKVIGAFVFAMIIAAFTQRIALPFLFPRIIARVRWRQSMPMAALQAR